MNPLQHALIEKAGGGDGFEQVLASAPSGAANHHITHLLSAVEGNVLTVVLNPEM